MLFITSGVKMNALDQKILVMYLEITELYSTNWIVMQLSTGCCKEIVTERMPRNNIYFYMNNFLVRFF
jgi:hypothetical protein